MQQYGTGKPAVGGCSHQHETFGPARLQRRQRNAKGGQRVAEERLQRDAQANKLGRILQCREGTQGIHAHVDAVGAISGP